MIFGGRWVGVRVAVAGAYLFRLDVGTAPHIFRVPASIFVTSASHGCCLLLASAALSKRVLQGERQTGKWAVTTGSTVITSFALIFIHYAPKYLS